VLRGASERRTRCCWWWWWLPWRRRWLRSVADPGFYGGGCLPLPLYPPISFSHSFLSSLPPIIPPSVPFHRPSLPFPIPYPFPFLSPSHLFLPSLPFLFTSLHLPKIRLGGLRGTKVPPIGTGTERLPPADFWGTLRSENAIDGINFGLFSSTK